jgi:hypothetical protein
MRRAVGNGRNLRKRDMAHTAGVKQSCLDRGNRGSLKVNAVCYTTRRLWGSEYESPY